MISINVYFYNLKTCIIILLACAVQNTRLQSSMYVQFVVLFLQYFLLSLHEEH